MGELTPEEAETLGAGIRAEWAVLASLLSEAVEQQAWAVAGYDRPADWLGDLPPLPDIAGAGTTPVRRRASAKVSRPGRTQSTTLGRRDVNPLFKEGKKR